MKRLLNAVMINILKAGALDIKDVDGGEDAFLYASGNWGPGYVTIKGLVGWKKIIRNLVMLLSVKVAEKAHMIDFVAGNVTGGMAPGWIISEYLETLLMKEIPFVYVRDIRKKGGQKELITGIDNNPGIIQGSNALIVEELANFAETTCNSAKEVRRKGHYVNFVTCILFYDNPIANELLKETEVEMIYLFALSQLLDVAEKHKTHRLELIEAYRVFLENPLEWQKARNLKPVKEGGTK